MARIIVLVGVFLLSLIGAKAQNLSIKGNLRDREDRTQLQGATVKLSVLTGSQAAPARDTLRRDSAARDTAIADSAVTVPIKRDTAEKYNIVTGKSGAFEFADLTPGRYLITISSVGYETMDREVLLQDSSVDLGSIGVPREAKTLGEVVIKVSPPPVRQKTDTLDYAASAYKVNPDANAEDMIKKMPGVTVDRGTVTAQGEQVRKVTIDGRDFFGDDATAALRNLPAEVIDRIQVFDRLSDQAQLTGVDDGNSVKAINIVTKADMRNGQFGRIYAGYGTDNRYSAGGNVTFFKNNRRISIVGQTNNINQQNFAAQDLLGATSNPRSGGNRGGGGGGGNRGGAPGGGGNFGGGNFGGGGQGNFLVGQQPGISKTNALGLNFSDQWSKKVTVSGSYFYNNTNNLNHEISNTQYIDDTLRFYRETSLTDNDNFNHRLNMRIEYRIDSSNSLLFTPRLSYQKNRAYSNLASSMINEFGDSLSQRVANESSSGDGYNFSGELLFRHAFASKRGRSMSVSLQSDLNRNAADIYNESIVRTYKGSIAQVDSVLQYLDQQSRGNRISANLVYTEPVGAKGNLQFNYNPSWSLNKADQKTFYPDKEGKYSIFDDSLSNKLDNTYNTQNGGVNYRVGDRDNSFSVGVNYQYAVLEGQQVFPRPADVKRSFGNVLPNFRLQRKLSAKSSLRIFYRTRTNAPSVTQLQDVANTRNVLFPTVGNPELVQDYSHSLVTRYQFTNSAKRTSFFANLFLQATQNYITNATYTVKKDSAISSNITIPQGAILTKPVNLDGYWSARSFFTWGMPLNFMKSNLNWNAGVSYTKIPGLVDNVENMSNNYTYNVGAVIASNISEYVDFTVSYSANFNVIKNSVQHKADNNYFNHVASFQLNLLSKSGWLFQNDLNNQMYRGLSAGFNQNYWLWNMAVGKKFLKDQKGDLRLSVFDLLKQNRAITRTSSATTIEDVQNDVLRQYFMLTFTYRLRNFGAAASNRPRS